MISIILAKNHGNMKVRLTSESTNAEGREDHEETTLVGASSRLRGATA